MTANGNGVHLGDPATSDPREARRLVWAALPHLTNADLHDLRMYLIPAEYHRRTVGLPGPQGETGTHVAFPGKEM